MGEDPAAGGEEDIRIGEAVTARAAPADLFELGFEVAEGELLGRGGCLGGGLGGLEGGEQALADGAEGFVRLDFRNLGGGAGAGFIAGVDGIGEGLEEEAGADGGDIHRAIGGDTVGVAEGSGAEETGSDAIGLEEDDAEFGVFARGEGVAVEFEAALGIGDGGGGGGVVIAATIGVHVGDDGVDRRVGGDGS